MFGLTDPAIWIAYLLTIGGTLLCVIYGVINWNKEDKEDDGK
jgi:hypothetical protein